VSEKELPYWSSISSSSRNNRKIAFEILLDTDEGKGFGTLDALKVELARII
jgi:hypothetical protein